MNKQFPRFWYDSNAVWGYVNSLADLKEKFSIVKTSGYIHTKDDFLDKSRRSTPILTNAGIPSFGTRREHCEKETLREFLAKYNVDLKDF